MDADCRDLRPLIMTLRLDDLHQQKFDALREAHFPPDRNFLSAHVTLFHKLPGPDLELINQDLHELMADQTLPVVTVSRLISLGGGVAFRLSAPEVDALRSRLADRWWSRLSAQDRQRGPLHVTVQNKALASTAAELHGRLAAEFAPTSFLSPGVDLWRYLGGPWDHVAGIDFAGG